MARIPLRDIPNAPGVAAQPTGGNLRRVNLGAAQSMLQQQTISPDAFSGPAKGMAAIAEGIGSIAGAGEKFAKAALHLQNLVDEDHLYQWKAEQQDAANKSREEIEANPANYMQYGEIVKRNLTGAYEGFLKKMDGQVSDRAKVLIEREHTATLGVLYGNAQAMGLRQAAENVKMGVLNDVKTFEDAGDMDGAVGSLEAQRGRGIMTDAEIDMRIQAARSASEAGRLASRRLERPDLAIEEARESKWLSPAMKLAEVQKARVETARMDGEMMNELHQLFEAGVVRTKEDAVKHFGERGEGFVARNPLNVKRALAVRKYSDTGAARKIIQDLRAMDVPENELDRLELYTAKATELRSVLLPEDFAKWKEPFDREFKGGSRDPVLKRISQYNSSFVKAGYFGGKFDDKKADEGDVEQIRIRDEVTRNVDTVDAHMEEWMKGKPRASSDEVMDEYQKFMQGNGWVPAPVRPGLLKRVGKTLFGAGETTDEFMQEAREANPSGYYKDGGKEWVPKGGAQSAVEGDRTTSFGYPGDPTPDSNSRHGIGAFVSPEEQRRIRAGLPSEKKMRPNDFAVSRDMEERMRAAGIEPEDEVRVFLADGSEVVGRWMDRTARSYKGRVLRGIIDLYSPTGVHEKDNVKILGWEKV